MTPGGCPGLGAVNVPSMGNAGKPPVSAAALGAKPADANALKDAQGHAWPELWSRPSPVRIRSVTLKPGSLPSPKADLRRYRQRNSALAVWRFSTSLDPEVTGLLRERVTHIRAACPPLPFR